MTLAPPLPRLALFVRPLAERLRARDLLAIAFAAMAGALAREARAERRALRLLAALERAREELAAARADAAAHERVLAAAVDRFHAAHERADVLPDRDREAA